MAIARSRFTLFACAALASAGLTLTVFPDGTASASPGLTLQEATAKINDLNAQADAANEAYDAAQIALNKAKTTAASASHDVDVQEQQIGREQRGLAALAASAYRSGGTDEFVALVTTKDPALFVEQATSLDQLARGRSSALLSMRTDRKRLAGLQETERDQVASAAAAAKAAAAQQSTIQGLIAKQRGIVNSLTASARVAYNLQQAHAAAQAQVQRTQAVTASFTGNASGIARAALSAAYQKSGDPYQYGGAGPSTFDCSGLTMWAFAQAGVSLPHSAAAQYGYGMHVSLSELQPGDLVFFDEGGYIGHVGIYVGGGDMIDAPHSGSYVGVRPLYPGFVGGTRL